MGVPLILLVLALGLAPRSATAERPDFSGRWTFDGVKSMAPGPDGRVVLAAMLGDEFTALQNPTSLTFRISFQGALVVAIYDLTGAASENISPGDIVVCSRAAWDGTRLVITSTSAGEPEDGRPVTIRSTRTLWIDETGDLVIERTGTPRSQVIPSRSIYTRVR